MRIQISLDGHKNNGIEWDIASGGDYLTLISTWLNSLPL